MNDILIYGAYGYTGKLIVKEAVDKGLKPILGGRNSDKLEKLSKQYDLPAVVLDLNEKDKLEDALKNVDVVIHCAGPFSATAIPMAEACLRTKTHYLDITGEYNVFQQLHKKDDQAKGAGVMILPGAGFDVVPSDCLASHLHKKIPDATHLLLAFTSKGGGVSRGTAKTMIEGSSEGQRYRKDGNLVTAPLGQHTKEIDYGPLKQLSVAISWGDIVTAYYSTGISNIEVYTGTKKKQVSQMKWMHRLRWIMKLNPIKNFLKKQVDKRPAGPSEEKRAKSETYLYGKIWNNKAEYEARMITLNGYTLTAKSSVLIASKILSGNFKPGFQTPATAYGADLILEIPGSELKS
ncbi:MAG: saccharopine dehydrogenase family protein [Candidatus Cyclobacteriaceae bacterium M2_1C_046]